MDRCVLSEDGMLYYLGRRRDPRESLEQDIMYKLVISTTLIDEIMLKCHDLIEGGHQGIAVGGIRKIANAIPTFP